MTTQNEVFEFLMKLPSDNPAQPEVVRIDTGANVIFLCGSKAFKVKRAVKYPFLDYSTLALRKEACHREFRLNTPNAPQLYLGARPVTRSQDGQLALDGQGPVVEWVVEMNRFDSNKELEILAERESLSPELADDLAVMMANAHDRAPPMDAGRFVDELRKYLSQNDDAFADAGDIFPVDQAKALSERANAVLTEIEPIILRRGEAGLVRLCHGDAHTRNIVLLDGKPVLFDAVEFSDDIATCDLLYDLAYLLMDLWALGQKAAANRVFNRYLDRTARPEDLEGLATLPFYLMMRAALRAKISAANSSFQAKDADRDRLVRDAKSYFQLAQDFLSETRPMFVAIGGFSGTGKTTTAYGLAPELGPAPGARVLRTDVERKVSLGLAEADPAPPEAYTRERSDAVYVALEKKARAVLAAGQSVIFDGVLGAPAERDRLEQIAAHADVPFGGIWLEVPIEIAKERVSKRENDASDATPEVIDFQATFDIEPLHWPRVSAGETPQATLAEVRKHTA